MDRTKRALIKAFLIVMALFILMSPVHASPLTVVVFPLEDLSESDTLSWLGEGIAESISRQIAAGREMRLIDRSQRLSLIENLDLPPGAQLSLGSMIRVAQRGAAHMMISGVYSGGERNLKISIRMLDGRTLKLGGEISAAGSVASLPEMENELAWLIINNSGLAKGLTRERFRERMRKASNSSYTSYIASLDAEDQNERLGLLLKAVDGQRDFPEARFALGSLHFQKGDCSRAMVHLAFSVDDPILRNESQFIRGLCLLGTDQPSQAATAFSSILASGRPFEVLTNLGAALLRKGDPLQALRVLMEAGSFDRQSPALALNLALAHYLSGDMPAARRVLEEGARAYPKDGMLHFAFGYVLNQQGESEKGLEYVSRARTLGVDTEKMQKQDPRNWTRTIQAWNGALQ